LAKRAGEQLLNEKKRNEIEEERGEDLVDAAPEMDRRRQARPCGSRHGRAGKRNKNRHYRLIHRPRQCSGGRADATSRNLSFRPDIDDAGPEADGDTASSG
jgi:hypothetical protein